jgi:hypothetical protein
LNLIQLFKDYGVEYRTEGKNCKPGWVNVRCCFCEDHSNHLGGSLETGAFNCWKCGAHGTVKTLSRLLRINEKDVYDVMKKYGGGAGFKPVVKDNNAKINLKPFKFPSGTEPMKKRHKRYLKKRGFSPKVIETFWGVMGTGMLSRLDKINYKHRLIAPIVWDGKVVSFQGRDVTGHAGLRYMACPKEREIIHHKDILYMNEMKITRTGICVEGITDVWRFGTDAFSTFGIEFTKRQVRVMANKFDNIIIVFDKGKQEQKQAKKLMNELRYRGVVIENVPLEDSDDPASMTQEYADEFVKNLIGKTWVERRMTEGKPMDNLLSCDYQKASLVPQDFSLPSLKSEETI